MEAFCTGCSYSSEDVYQNTRVVLGSWAKPKSRVLEV